ncbi:hypothetical protein ALC56_00275 [Trachymyrmex septentrionalis]|uniref:Uncharacterized protein n=1 Tax=Trachymyrmex septentrionalis TaxID=34720 RepID=A0A151K164_9HYME|nr:hypothetical protein ALC56_00275 [Trachymyrmex septentrionalis]
MDGVIHANKEVSLCVKSRFNNFCEKMDCIVIPMQSISIPKRIKLADPDCNVPASIDILIGILLKTHFGWIISGVTPSDKPDLPLSLNFHLTTLDKLSLNNLGESKYIALRNSHTMPSPSLKTPITVYWQVLVDSTQTSLQRVFWRESQDEPIKTFEGSKLLRGVREFILSFDKNSECGALLLAQVISKISKCLMHQISIYLWTDFTIELQRALPIDIINVSERKSKTITAAATSTQEPDIFYRYSSFTKFIRVFEYMIRFIERSKGATRASNQSQEISFSRSTYIFERATTSNFSSNQSNIIEAFKKKIKSLSNHEAVPTNSPILKLNPFLDDSGILRVHLARITRNANLPLIPISLDPNDFTSFTPGHFLVGTPLTFYLESSLDEIPVNCLSRWQYIQLRQHF